MAKLQLLTETVRTLEFRLAPLMPQREQLPMHLVDPGKPGLNAIRRAIYDPHKPRLDDPHKPRLDLAHSTWSKPGWSYR